MVRNLFNLATAWLSVLLLALVAVIWILRIMVQKKAVPKNSFLYRVNITLRRYHKAIGILFLIIALIHGMLSSFDVLSLNWGSISFLFMAIMGLSYMLKKKVQRKIWVNSHRVLTVLVVLTFAVHIDEVSISGLALLQTPTASVGKIELTQEQIGQLQDETSEVMAYEDEVLSYADGTYTGAADAYGPDLTVEVTILNNLITNVAVVSHNEVNERFWSLPIEILPGEIVSAQSIDIDSISGATYTSVGIKNAVLDALNQAVTAGELPEPEEIPTGFFGRKRGGGH